MGQIRLWDLGRNESKVLFEDGEGHVTSAAFSPDGELAAATLENGDAMLWRAKDGESIAVLTGHEDAILAASFSPKGRSLVTASKDGTLRVWDPAGREIAVLRGHQGPVSQFAFSANSRRLASASVDGRVRLWDIDEARTVSVIEGNGAPIETLALRGDGQRLITAVSDAVVSDRKVVCDNSRSFSSTLWTTDPVARLAELGGHGGIPAAAAFSPDGTKAMTVSLCGGHRIWDSDDGMLLARGGGDCPDYSHLLLADFSPDGRRIISVNISGRIRLWDSHTGIKLITLHSNPITRSINRTPDHCVFNFMRPPYPTVLHAALSADGRIAVTGDADGKIHVFEMLPDTQSVIEAARRRVPRELTQRERRQFFLDDQ